MNNLNNNDINIINSYKSDDYYLEYFINNQNNDNNVDNNLFEKKMNNKKYKKNFEKLVCSSSSEYNENSSEENDSNHEVEDINEPKNNNYKVNKKNISTLNIDENNESQLQRKSQLFHNNYNIKKIFCTNCGKYGHNYKKCIYPITSVGIICVLFTPVYFNDIIYYIKKFQLPNSNTNNTHVTNDELIKLNKIYENIKNIDEQNYDKIIKYLMVQRKYSFSYVEILRGKYELDNIDYINNMIQYMTFDERKRLLTLPFQQLWDKLWYITDKEINREKEMNISNEKFNLLKNGLTITKNDIHIEYSLNKLIKNAKYKYNLPEWGFPKGRRNLNEKNIDCAHREFKEETALKNDEYQIINLSPLEELFMGMNNIRYKNIYYISQICKKVDIKVDQNNELQKIEISDIQWYTLNQTLDIIREYDIEKRNVIINNHNSLKSIFFIFQSLLKKFLKK